jgi:hypothetical protein
VDVEEECAKPENIDSNACQFSDRLRIQGISVTDVDLDLDRVVVEITTTNDNSMVSFNAGVDGANLDMADFNSCSTKRNGRTWRCDGDGNDDSEMRFLAQPGDLNVLFDGLEFASLESSFRENVTIRIYDGSGDGCQAEIEHTEDPASVRNDECLLTEKMMRIEVGT